MPPTKSKIPATIQLSLRAAQSDLDDVPKDSTNSFHKYKYTSSEQMITSCREALLNAGLTMSELGSELVDVAGVVAARVTYRLVHSESHEAVEWTRDFPIVPEKGRPVDKAYAGSLTTNLSYALRGLLLVPRVDPESEMDSDVRPAAKSTSRESTFKPNTSHPSAHTRAPSGVPADMGNGVRFDRGDQVVETGENPEHMAGRSGEVFWVKGDRIGVRWGEGKEDVVWGYMREFDASDSAAQPEPPTNSAPVNDDDSIPF